MTNHEGPNALNKISINNNNNNNLIRCFNVIALLPTEYYPLCTNIVRVHIFDVWSFYNGFLFNSTVGRWLDYSKGDTNNKS